MYEVDLQPVGKRATASSEASLLDVIRRAGIELASVCGGEGHCGQCRVVVLAGEVSPPTADEASILTELEIRSGERLACCTYPKSNVKIHLPNSSLLTHSRLQIESSLRDVPVDPLIAAYAVEIERPSLAHPISDLERVAAAVPAAPHLCAEPAVLRQISNKARDYQWRISVYVRGAEVVGIAPYARPPVGMAVDLGTTKIAAFLLDLETGEELASDGALNPQIGYGEDIISRLNYARRHADGAQVLAEALCKTLDDLLGKLTRQAGVERCQVADLCMVGNTAMTHLLLQLPTGQLAVAPYVATSNLAVDVKARDLGLTTAPGAYVHIPPGIGGFIGADQVAMMLASDMDRAERVTLGIDIGTNTEIALAKPGAGFLSSLSCASGPAFEGAHVSDGMRAAAGAIEAVRLQDTTVHLKTIDHAPPIGMCGSGIIDAVAELRRWQIINARGRFDKGHARTSEGRFGPELLLAPASDSGSGRNVAITQKDVNEIQLAKGAIRAGLEVLLLVTETSPDDVQEVIIAGAFGSFLDVESALDAGLLPYYPNAVYRQVGNAAAVGAKWALVSRAERERARRIASATRYVELTTYPKFSRLFALGMLFPADDALRNKK
ncbi:MAG: DUF4445 domain-containing protein [Anaerolineae bacterium]|nr:DUF4445 domain-containing protein [Anaerolineae bacterium]